MSNDESLKETGRCAAAAIVEMVAALECDYDRLEELRQQAKDFAQLDPEAEYSITPEALTAEESEELKELEEAAGECESREDAEARIQEDALDVSVRSGWYAPTDGKTSSSSDPEEFSILLSTGGPASRIRGELSNGEPCRAWLEVQDWGTPWTQYFDIEQDTLLAYARCFYFGEG